jgi:hypothetical protein
MAKRSAFGTAFAAARAAGKKTFEFGGKSYNTKRADDPKEGAAAKDKSVVATAKRGLDKADKAAAAPSASKVRPKARASAKSGASRSTAGKATPAKPAAKAPSKPAAATGPQRPPRADAPPSPPKVGRRQVESFASSFARTPLARGIAALRGTPKARADAKAKRAAAERKKY